MMLRYLKMAVEGLIFGFTVALGWIAALVLVGVAAG